MKTRPLLFLAMAFITGLTARAAPFSAFADGERYVYKVGWGIFGGAGRVVISAQRDTLDGRPVMRIATQTSSRGLVRGIYRYDDIAEVVVDIATGRLVYAEEKGEDSKRKTESRTDFDYARGIAVHRDRYRPHRDRDMPIPAGDPIDLISSLVAPRHWDIKTGDARDLLVHFGSDFFPVTLHAEGTENVRTPMGTFNTLRLVPRMDKEPPRGLFQRGGEIKVWISQDGERLPVKMQLKLNFGTATLLLEERTIAAGSAPSGGGGRSPARSL